MKKGKQPMSSVTRHPPEWLDQKCSPHYRPWSDLQREILELILNHLNFADHVRFGAVCVSWRSVAVERHHHKALKYPWLMGALDTRAQKWGLFSPMDTKAYHLELPVACEGRCMDSAEGWLIMTDGNGGYFLLNPFTKKQIQLPHASSVASPEGLKYEISRPFFLEKGVLTSAPTLGRLDDGSCIIVATSNGRLFFCRPLDEVWSVIPNEPGWIFNDCADIVFHEGLLYVLTWEHVIVVLKFDPNPEILSLYELEAVSMFHVADTEEFYLAASAGELLMVLKLGKGPRDDHDDDYDDDGIGDEVVVDTYWFSVFKLDTITCKWVLKESLGNQMLFVGSGCSKSCKAADNSGYRGNCIYFPDTGDCSTAHDIPFPIGVFCLEDGSNEPCCPNYSPSSNHPPIWFMPDG